MRLFKLDYSPYARKVQMLLDLLGLAYEAVEIDFGDREELATLTGGYVQVPVLVDDAGAVTVDSRAICERLLRGEAAARFVPAPWQGPIWAYADWCDGALEDVLFRFAAPARARQIEKAWDRALYVFVKERKFGAGCIDAWETARPELLARAAALLRPTCETLEAQPFLFGARPTLADAALYGLVAMLESVGEDARPLGAPILPWARRLEASRPRPA